MFGQIQGAKGEFRRLNLNQSVTVQPGDLATVIAGQLVITRNGQAVATRDIVGPEISVPLEATESEPINHIFFFRSKPVSGKLSTMTSVQKNTLTGAITFGFSDGTQLEFSSGASVIENTDYIDTDPTLGQHILARKAMLNSPDETNLETMVGATCAIDCNATQPVSIRID